MVPDISRADQIVSHVYSKFNGVPIWIVSTDDPTLSQVFRTIELKNIAHRVVLGLNGTKPSFLIYEAPRPLEPILHTEVDAWVKAFVEDVKKVGTPWMLGFQWRRDSDLKWCSRLFGTESVKDRHGGRAIPLACGLLNDPFVKVGPIWVYPEMNYKEEDGQNRNPEEVSGGAKQSPSPQTKSGG